MRLNKLIGFVVLFLIAGCSKTSTTENKTASAPEEDATALLQNFPIQNLRELVQLIPDEEFRTLVEKGESQNWKLEKKTQNDFTAKSKEFDDNQVDFLVIRPASGRPMIVARQVNAQVVVTKGWRYDDNEQWTELELPAITGKQFAAENVNVPNGYDEMQAYLNVELKDEKILVSVNQWIISKDLETSYGALSGNILDSFFKYYYEIEWNGEEFTINKQQEKDYTEIFKVTAEIEEEDPDGPGITEFDCRVGYDVEASSELKPSGNVNYSAQNLLKDDNAVWSEGADGSGANEWIQFTMSGDYLIGRSYQLKNGFVKSNSLWKANNRVKTFDVLLNERLIATVTLQDDAGYQSFDIIPSFIKKLDVKKGDKVRFVIKEVYKGEKYDDTVISYFVTQGNCG